MGQKMNVVFFFLKRKEKVIRLAPEQRETARSDSTLLLCRGLPVAGGQVQRRSESSDLGQVTPLPPLLPPVAIMVPPA